MRRLIAETAVRIRLGMRASDLIEREPVSPQPSPDYETQQQRLSSALVAGTVAEPDLTLDPLPDEPEFVAPEPRPQRTSAFKGTYAQNVDEDLRKAYQEAKNSGIPVSMTQFRETFPNASKSVFQEIERDIEYSLSSVRQSFNSVSMSRGMARGDLSEDDDILPRSLTRSPPPDLGELLESPDRLQMPAAIPRIPPPAYPAPEARAPRGGSYFSAILVGMLFFFLASQAT